MGSQPNLWVHWRMEGAGGGTVLCCVRIVGTKMLLHSNSSWRSLGKLSREEKQIRTLLCFLSARADMFVNADGGSIKQCSPALWESGAAWRHERRNNFITCRDPLLISIYPLGSLSRTLNSSGCRWTGSFFFFFLQQLFNQNMNVAFVCSGRLQAAERTS